MAKEPSPTNTDLAELLFGPWKPSDDKAAMAVFRERTSEFDELLQDAVLLRERIEEMAKSLEAHGGLEMVKRVMATLDFDPDAQRTIFLSARLQEA